MRYRTTTGQLLQVYIIQAQSCRYVASLRQIDADGKDVEFWKTRYHHWRHLCIREVRRLEKSLGLPPRSSRDWVVTHDWIDPQH